MVDGRRSFVALAALLAGACAGKQPAPRVKPTEPLIEEPAEPPVAAPEEAAFQCDDSDVDWPVFQRDEGRTGSSPAPAIAEPTVAWSHQIGIASWLDNPIIAAGHVYAPSSGQVWNRPDGADGVYAFDLATGEQKWFTPTADDANGAAYDNCRIFVGSDDGSVSAIDARTGEQLWTIPLGTKAYANPLPLADVVIVGGSIGPRTEDADARGFIAAVDVETGETRWQHEVGGAVRGGAASDGERIYFTSEDARVTALARDDGKPLWQVKIEGPGVISAYAAPTVWRGQVYVPFVRNTYYETPAMRAYRADDGSPTWVAKNTRDLGGGWGNLRSSPAHTDDTLFWGEPYSNRIVSLNVLEGDVASSIAAGLCTFPHWPSPAIAAELVYVPRHDGGLYAYDAAEGALRWSLYLGDANNVSRAFPPEHQESGADRCQWDPPFGKPIYASPAVADDGTIVVATGDGWLHAIRDTR